MLSPMIEDLLKPEALPDPTRRVSLVQTHISLVFVADEFVYKVKKPVNFGFLDFTTFEKRAFYCRKELELNRRLAKDIYLGVLPVRFDGKKYSLRSRKGEIVEHAVKMKRISEKRLMKSLYERGALTENHLRRLARTLAAFHGHGLRSPEIDGFGESNRFRINTDENFAQIRKYIGVSIEKKHFRALRGGPNVFTGQSRTSSRTESGSRKSGTVTATSTWSMSAFQEIFPLSIALNLTTGSVTVTPWRTLPFS
jgi:uncharacterized protein